MNFAPSVYEHAAALIGRTPFETSRDPDLLFHAHAKAYRLYCHTPIIVGIDIYNLEAEAYGATIRKPEDNGIPAIHKPIGSEPDDILSLPPFNPKSDGRIPMVIETGTRLAREFPEADVRIPVSGPFSLASNLIGFDGLLCALIENPSSVHKALMHIVQAQIDLCGEIAARKLGIAFFESGATPPLLSPELFSEVELPALKTMLGKASALSGHPIPCIIGGNTEPILDSILSTGTGYVICPAETDQRRFMEKMREVPNVAVRINANSNVFATGIIETVYRELERCIALASGRSNACIGSGALPFETDPDIVLKARDFVRKWA
jgi:uroporphyrinogen decarboxylase